MIYFNILKNIKITIPIPWSYSHEYAYDRNKTIRPFPPPLTFLRSSSGWSGSFGGQARELENKRTKQNRQKFRVGKFFRTVFFQFFSGSFYFREIFYFCHNSVKFYQNLVKNININYCILLIQAFFPRFFARKNLWRAQGRRRLGGCGKRRR